MRLTVLEHGHTPDVRAELNEFRRREGGVPDARAMLSYRPELFGRPFREAVHAALHGPSDWSPAEREFLATFVSAQNQCRF